MQCRPALYVSLPDLAFYIHSSSQTVHCECRHKMPAPGISHGNHLENDVGEVLVVDVHVHVGKAVANSERERRQRILITVQRKTSV
eukprot:1563977-Rhodomonas_salina.4